MPRARCAHPAVVAAVCLIGWSSLAEAQLDSSFFKRGGAAAASGKPTVEVTLAPETARPGDEVTLSIAINLPEGSSTYSQDPTFQKPTVITVSESPGLEPLGDGFVSDIAPERKYDPQFKLELEKFFDDVTWSRRFRVRPDASADSAFVRGKLQYLVCDDESCRPFTHNFAVSLTGAPVPPPPLIAREPAVPAAAAAVTAAPAAAVYAQEITPTSKVAGTLTNEPLKLTFDLPPDAQAGDTISLTIAMTLDEGWHTFSMTPASDKQVGLPTVLKFDTLHNLEAVGEFTESPAPELYLGTDNAHFGSVTWTRRFKVTGAEYGVAGSIRYSVCDKSTCKRPRTIDVALGIVPAAASVIAEPALAAGADTPLDPESIEIAQFDLVEAEQSESLLVNLLFAFLGGLILNVMPCVLPVIAIKVISFVQQAGESRGRILALNVAYTAGVVLVFLTLATLAVVLNQGWGGLFQNAQFNLVMAAFVFAMGLSLLGVFEISLPGIAGGGTHREGLPGAFFTGIFATLLATPCTGPFMGTTLAWSVKQSPAVVFLIWGVMGLGMASPYLVIGAFPKLVNWLPRPGMWMVRFKEFAGFVLMGAVIWLISSLHADLLIPALVILVGIALGLWMIGNLYDTTSPVKHKWTVRALAFVLSGIVIGFGWNMQYRSMHVLWEPFSTARIEQLRREGKPILIDFTADWCLICKTNEAVALDRPETAEFLRRHGITAIKADFTDESPEISRWLDLARQEGVPLTLIFPRGQPNRAIPLRAAFTQGQLLEALKSATDDTPELAGELTPAAVATPASSTLNR